MVLSTRRVFLGRAPSSSLPGGSKAAEPDDLAESWRLARAAEAVAGRPVAWPLHWECRAGQSRQARPEEPQEPQEPSFGAAEAAL